MRKREKRVFKELHRLGTPDHSSGWAGRQASKRHNVSRKKRVRKGKSTLTVAMLIKGR